MITIENIELGYENLYPEQRRKGFPLEQLEADDFHLVRRVDGTYAIRPASKLHKSTQIYRFNNQTRLFEYHGEVNIC